jgi:hypothetical protein
MKKILAYIVLLLCVAIYWASSFEKATKSIAEYKYKLSGSLLRSDKYRYGDLFGMSYLSSFQIKNTREDASIKKIVYNVPKKINLYAFCDSYLWDFAPSDTFYCGVDKFMYVKTTTLDKMNVRLDTNKTNILLFEFVERYIIDQLKYNDPYLQSFLTNDTTKPEQVTSVSNQSQSFKDILFNSYINTNIEFNIWETALFTPIKEWKADANYKLFNRVDENVLVSPDARYLLYRPTVDTTCYTSSFTNIDNATIDTIVTRLNTLYFKYKKMGFKQVYFSFIPNPVSVLYPHFNNYHYNNLIERIELSPLLKMPFIDVYKDFKRSPYQLYFNNNTHWNMNGCNMWLNNFNDSLNTFVKKN